MACRPIRNKEGQITGMSAANGERSLLFDSLANQKKLGSARAYQIYADLRLRKFTDWFGAKWDTPSAQPTQASEIDFDKLRKLSKEKKVSIFNLKDHSLKQPIQNGDTKITDIIPDPTAGNFKILFDRPSGQWMVKLSLDKGVFKKTLFQNKGTKNNPRFVSSSKMSEEFMEKSVSESIPANLLLSIEKDLKNVPSQTSTSLNAKDFAYTEGIDKKYGIKRTLGDIAGKSVEPTQQTGLQSSIFTDKNGEPKIISGDGKLEVMNLKGEIRPLSDFVATYQLMDPKVELELLDIASDVVVDSSRSARNLLSNVKETKLLLNPTIVDGKLVDNGVLAKIMLTEGFPGLGRSIQSQEYALQVYRVYQNNGAKAALQYSREQGKPMAPAGMLFFRMYENWNDQVDSNGNVAVTGYRNKIRERLESHNIQWKEDTEELVIEDDTPVKIYGINRLQENPRNKLSAEAKAALVGIKYVDPDSLLKANVSMTVDKVYGILTQGVVNSKSFPEMLAKLEYSAKYNPEVRPVLKRLREATPQQQAAIFSNFALVYKNFLMLQIDRKVIQVDGKPEVKTTTNLFNPNEGAIERRYRTLYNENSVERTAPNPRALYKETEEGTLEPIASKIQQAETAYARLERAIKASAPGTVSREASDALGEYLWALGMQYGPTLETTQDALAKLFEIGSTVGGALQQGRALFEFYTKPSISGTKKSLKYLLDRAKKGINIYQTETSMVRHVAGFAPLFDSQYVGSFISGTNKQFWPINQATLLDELGLTISSADGEAYLRKLERNKFYDPSESFYTYKSPLLSELSSNVDYRLNHFSVETLDSVKEPSAVNDYKSQSDRVSLVIRLNAYANNNNLKYTRIAVPTEADRGVLHFMVHPRYDKLKNFTREDIIKGFLAQDLVRKADAEKQVLEAEETGDTSKLIEGYHFDKEPFDRKGNAFTLKMSQIESQIDPEVDGMLLASDLIEGYLSVDEDGARGINADQVKLMDQYFENEVQKVNDLLEGYEQDIKQRIKDNKIDLKTEVHKEQSSKPDFIKDFVFNDFVGRIETVKLVRGGFTHAKDMADFYKRMALLTTPGQKLYIRDPKSDAATYGMMPTYKELTIADFDYVDSGRADEVADAIRDNLTSAGVSEERASEIADKYRPGKGMDKTDAQGFISIDMYRGIQTGLGAWTSEDEQAYRNEKAGNGYVDGRGNPRPIYPIKPYHEELTDRNGVMTLTMNKNSYTVITRELAEQFPMFAKMYEAFENGVDVINPRTATKGSKINVQDVTQVESLDVSNAMVMDSTKLRLPQIMPKKKKSEILFSRQVRKNSIANIDVTAKYENGMTGQQVFDTYSNTIAENIKEDTAILERELGITELRKQKPDTKEYADAKYNYLVKVRKRLIEQVKDKQLPDNYIKALDIVPDGPNNWRFRAPLSFPNYQAKFEQIFLSTFKNGIFNQYIRGRELVQVAEAGGHIEDSELRMYNGSNRAEVRIKRSMLGLPKDAVFEDTDPMLLQAIGYRVPHQGKNSSLPIQVVGFLPDSHEKAIMVPGGVTVQMGSDFDIDKMFIIQPEVEKIDGKLQKVSPAYNESNPTRKQRDARIYDMLDTILTSKNHLEEVVAPLDNPILEELAENLRTTSVNYSYNHPLVEISMERRNKTGQRQTGTWANFIAGHNVLSVNPLPIMIPFKINSNVFGYVGAVKDVNGNFVDQSMSYYLNAAVDAAKKPIHVDINDNYMTAPVAGMMLSAGVAIEDVVHFVSQPIIKRAVEVAQNEEISINRAINKVGKELFGNYEFGQGTFPMDSETLEYDASLTYEEATDGKLRDAKDRQRKYLDTFKTLLKQGQQLQQLNQLLTPDTLENVNEMSSLVAYNESREDFMNNPNILILDAKTLLESDKYPVSKAYDSIRQTSLNAAEEAGFINNRPAFYEFKELLKSSLGKTKLTAAQHKFIDRSLFLKLMAQPDSPLANLMSEEAFTALYTNPNSNIATRLESIKKEFPKLAQNSFIQKLKPSKANNDLGQTIFTIELDTSYDMTSADKNRLSNDLLQLVRNPSKYVEDINDLEGVREIQKFGKMLVSNQLLSKGFAPGPGAYIDLIPIELLDTKALNPDADLTPMEYFQQIQKSTRFSTELFGSFISDFVRNFGTARPGGVPLLKVQRLNRGDRARSVVSIENNKIGTPDGVPQYFVTYLPTGPKIFVLSSYGRKYSTYEHLQPLGVPNRVHEVLSNRSDAESLVPVMDKNQIVRRPGEIMLPAMGMTLESADRLHERLNNRPESVELPMKLCTI